MAREQNHDVNTRAIATVRSAVSSLANNGSDQPLGRSIIASRSSPWQVTVRDVTDVSVRSVKLSCNVIVAFVVH